MDFQYTHIVLVGHCNNDPQLQELIGTIVFRKNEESGQLEPRLIYHFSQEEPGTAKNPLKPNIQWKNRGEYGLSFPDFAGGDGVMIMLNKSEGKYRFITGINPKDSGSSGPLSNGGPELTEVLDELFFAP